MSLVWGARGWLRATKEATWGTFDGSATVIHWIRLAGDSAFAMFPTPAPYIINSADSLNEPIQTEAQQIRVSGGLVTPLYHSQAADLLAWGMSPIATGTPATYSLASYTLDHFDGVRTRRYLGCRVASIGIAAPASGPAMLTFSLVGWKPDSSDPTLAEPGIADFPTTTPYILQSTKGGVKLGADAVRTGYRSLSLTIANILDSPFCEDVYVSDILYCGRTITLDTQLAYVSGTASTDRAAYEGQTANAKAEALFTQGSNSIKFDMHTKARITNYASESPLGAAKFTSMTLTGFMDAAQTPDKSFTLTVTTA